MTNIERRFDTVEVKEGNSKEKKLKIGTQHFDPPELWYLQADLQVRQ
jgi:hypothetical protein